MIAGGSSSDRKERPRNQTLYRRGAENVPLFPGAHAVEDTLLDRPVQAIECKAAKALHGLFQIGALRVGGGHNVIKFFVRHLCITGNRPVDQGFHLAVHGVEIDRCGQDDYIGSHHFVEDFRHVVLLHASVCTVADTAACAVMDVFVTKEDLFHRMAGLRGAAQEGVAQDIRVTALAGTC